MRRTKLLWFGGGLALGALAIRQSVSRATEIERIVVDKVIDGDPPPRAKPRGKAVSNRFDALFERHGRGIPVAYLRSLAKRESNLDPLDQEGRRGS